MARIDFHSHILPRLDHGCRSVEISLKQLELIGAGGTDTVVATSHFYPERTNMDDFRRHRNASVKVLAEALPEKHPNIIVGAEVACYPGLHRMEGLEELCLAGTDCLLLEMPLARWNDALYETVDGILERGIRVVLAHIDRYDPKDVRELMELDVMAQINASSLLPFFRRRKLMRWFEQDRVVALGSDLHGAAEGGYDHFTKAMEKLGDKTVENVMAHTEALIKDAAYLSRIEIHT